MAALAITQPQNSRGEAFLQILAYHLLVNNHLQFPPALATIQFHCEAKCLQSIALVTDASAKSVLALGFIDRQIHFPPWNSIRLTSQLKCFRWRKFNQEL